MQLPKTREALADLAANSKYGMGGHLEEDPRAGMYGLQIGEVDYDPLLHEPEDIINDSAYAEASGIEQVAYMLPARPLHFNVVADLGSVAGSLPVRTAKEETIMTLSRELRANPGDSFDSISMYVLGGTRKVRQELRAEKVKSDRQLLEICSSGLTFVLSDFSRLMAVFHNRNIAGTVGLKVDHLLEVSVPRMGELVVGKGKELDTANEGDRAAFNARLERHHAGILDDLERSEISAVQIVTPTDLQGNFNVQTTDVAIANAIKSLR